MLLVAGGARDPNIQSLLHRLRAVGVPCVCCLTGGEPPQLYWDLQSDALTLDGRVIEPDAVFLRYDVFEQLQTKDPDSAESASAWFTTLTGWALAHPRVVFFNRSALMRGPNKPYALALAQSLGLAIPKTVVTNDLARLAATDEPRIAKPVMDGGYCEPLDDCLIDVQAQQLSRHPATVQTRLIAPEMRIYHIAGQFVSFDMASPDLDYRRTQSATVTLQKTPQALQGLMAQLAHALGLDFCAADFKTCPDTGQLLFLEANSAPMFAAFDRVSNHAVSNAIITGLMGV